MVFINSIRNTIYLPFFSFSVKTTNHILTKLAKIGPRILNQNICAWRYLEKFWKSTPNLAEPQKLYNIYIENSSTGSAATVKSYLTVKFF